MSSHVLEATAPVILTTVDIKVEARHSIKVPIASLVAEALREFLLAAPSSSTGKFETKAGLDVSWTVTTGDAETHEKTSVVAVNDALRVCIHGTKPGIYCHSCGGYR